MTKIKKIKVAPGITWVEIPLAQTYILCGTPADSVKHLIKNGMIQDIEKESINIFVIDKNFISLPDFINEYIENNSKKVICIENFCLYKK